jgi:hypothetical protein
VRTVTLKYMLCECTACGEQTACTILDGDQLAMALATLAAMGAAGWEFVTRNDADFGWVCGGCYAAIGGIPGGRGA